MPTRTTKSPNGRTKSAAIAPTKPQKRARKARPETSVCVYCGSGIGSNPAYPAAAREVGTALARAGIGLVYGGGSLGLMGEVARATLAAGGYVTGIIPEFLTAREHMLTDVSELLITTDMHERKRLMFERSSAFVALPGGIGTLEELVEQLTWSQLGRHQKPIVVANVAEFWSPFLSLLAHMKADQFIRTGLDVRFTVVNDARHVVPAIAAQLGASGATTPDAAVLAKF
ncbi:MAG: TIGR00730 family Rossman fold protein [Hyphomicrobium sp.]|nr:TIGR00730 family Rossman fold protein [Hyphomicrobium sp.]